MLIHSLSWFSKKGPVLWILFLFCSLLFVTIIFTQTYNCNIKMILLFHSNDFTYALCWEKLCTVQLVFMII